MGKGGETRGQWMMETKKLLACTSKWGCYVYCAWWATSRGNGFVVGGNEWYGIKIER